MSRLTAVLALALLTLSQGCCALVAGSYANVRLDSDPPGAVVSFGNDAGVTPCVLHVRKSSKPRAVRFSLQGRETVQQEVTSTVTLGTDRPVLIPLAIIDGLLIVPGIVDLCLGDCFYDWPVSINGRLAETGKPGLIDVQRAD